MTNSMKVYATIKRMQDELLKLEIAVDGDYWPSSLKKVGALLSNAEFNQAKVVAEQALHRATQGAA